MKLWEHNGRQRLRKHETLHRTYNRIAIIASHAFIPFYTPVKSSWTDLLPPDSLAG